jgi:hypothetical protein
MTGSEITQRFNRIGFGLTPTIGNPKTKARKLPILKSGKFLIYQRGRAGVQFTYFYVPMSPTKNQLHSEEWLGAQTDRIIPRPNRSKPMHI